MTTDRPYSKAMTFEAAVMRLKSLAGKKFDATCVDAFERAFQAGDISQAKAHRASIASRRSDVHALFAEPSHTPEAAAAGAPPAAAV
jgi:HD-GYP domain-containing protein (c-di-GMP phosphodiesterase class II)